MPAAWARPATFDYFYVEANEGGSAGGHAAIRFDEHTYHFQYAPSGLLEMARTPTSDFLQEYALLSNRSVHVTRVAVDPETREAIRRAFDRRYWRQQQELHHLGLLERARRWVVEASVRAPVAGAGYFDPERPSPGVRRLRQRIEARYGGDALARREQYARGQAGRDAEAMTPDLPESLEAATAALAAVEILRTGRGLEQGWLVADGDGRSTLSEGERDRLAAIRASLEGRLVELFASRRPDWGTPFLVGVARLLALDASLERGRLVFLDTFPSDAPTVTPRGERWRQVGPRLLEEAGQRFDSAKQVVLAQDGYREIRFVALEAAANQLADMRVGVEGGGPIRTARGRLLPRRAALGPALENVRTERLSRALRLAHATAREALEERNRYHVIDRNCVSAIFETIDTALAGLAGSDSSAAVRAESIRRLGGSVEPGDSLAFIPFVSSRQVRSRYRVVDSFVLLSDRKARLQEMRRDEPDVWVALRESNVLTSTIYERSRDDSLFLFFTEDPVVTRPIQGALNLAVGVGGSAAGLLWAPFDRGELLLDGLRGVLASVPELFFVNIRKGSNDYVLTGSERALLPGDGVF